MRQPATRESLHRWMRWLTGTFLVLFVMVWEHVQALNLEKQVTALSKEADRLTYENGRLQLQIHQAVAPGHLEEVARKQLGMVPLDASHVIDIQDKVEHSK